MSQHNNPPVFEKDFSLKQMVISGIKDIKYLWQFRTHIAIIIVLGALTGALAAYFKKPTYTARLTFVVDDSKSSGSLGGLSSLAGQFGLNVDGVGGGSGVLQGDNIQELVKSHNLIKNTLTTAYDSTSTLADKYAAVYHLDEDWIEHSPDGKVVRFPLNGKNNTYLQDSLLHEMIERILDYGQFKISKPDKKLGFFELNTTFKDERLSLFFCQRIMQQSIDFYISTTTKRQKNNIDRLQLRADSLERVLNNKTYSVSASGRTALDLNPAYTEEGARVEVQRRDKVVLNTIYSETLKNLEASKTMLVQETPTVQIVDQPELPLKKNKWKYWIAITTGILVGLIVFSTFKLSMRPEEELQ